MRRSMQNQIAEMERQLAQCRATARAAQRDRDEVIIVNTMWKNVMNRSVFMFLVNVCRSGKKCRIK